MLFRQTELDKLITALSYFELSFASVSAPGHIPWRPKHDREIEVYLATQQTEVAQQELEAATSLINTLNDDGLKQRLESGYRYYAQQFEKALPSFMSRENESQQNLQGAVQEYAVWTKKKQRTALKNQIKQPALKRCQTLLFADLNHHGCLRT